MQLRKVSLVVLVIAILVSPCVFSAPTPSKESFALVRETSDAFTSVAQAVIPAVVSIQVEKTIQVKSNYDFYDPFNDDFFERFFGVPRSPQQQAPNQQKQKQTGQGSGFVISKDGYILTNNHLVGKVDNITVKFSDGRELPAKLIGADEKSDVAVVKIEGDDYPVVELGDSDATKIGQWVIAVGNPFGLSATVTVGVVSAKGRSVGIAEYEDFIQTDAAINPGNSGGPLLDIDGKAIGINTAIFSQSGGYMGIGFAIPINMAKMVKDQLIKTGKVTRGYLGISMNQETMSSELAKHFGLKKAQGVLITEVMKDSPAEKAGLKQDDIILSINDKKVNNPTEFRNNVAMLAPGTEVKLTIFRDGKEIEKKVEVGDLAKSPMGQEVSKALEKIGIQVQDVTKELADKLGIQRGQGVIITQVENGSTADRAGIEEGMLILSVNRKPVNSVAEFNQAINKALKDNDENVMLRIKSGQYAQYIIVPLEK